MLNIIKYNISKISNNPQVECRFKKNIMTIHVWPILDKIVYCLAPFILILVFNILIITNISRAQKFRYVLYESRVKLTDSYNSVHMNIINEKENNFANSSTNKLISRTNFTSNVINNHNIYVKKQNIYKFKPKSNGIGYRRSNPKSEEERSRNSKLKKSQLFSKRLTIMLLSISFSFLLLTFPVVVVYVLLDVTLKNIDSLEDLNESNKSYEWLAIAQKITGLLMYLNHSINFFIYFFTGARFRTYFKRIVSKKTKLLRILSTDKNFLIKRNTIVMNNCVNKQSALYD